MLYGYMAYFDAQEKLLEALKALKKAGYRHLEAITPTPLEGLGRCTATTSASPGWPSSWGSWGRASASSSRSTPPWTTPTTPGEAPLGWPAFIPVTFEITILTITVGIFLYLLYLNGLPLAAHPAVLAPRYREALVDRPALFVYATDPRFDPEATRDLLRALGAEVEEVRRA